MSITKVTNSMISGAPFSVLDYGAIGNGIADDTSAIQATLDAAATAGTCIYIPSGTYKTTSALTIPERVGIKGNSADSSIIRPTGCDGLIFAVSNGIGPVVLEDFWVYGDGSSTYNGISYAGTIDAALKVYGLRINRVKVQNFRDAINLRSVWNSSITNCILYFNVFGVVLRGQCVKIDVRNNWIHHNLLGSTTPTATGVYVASTFDYDPSGITEKRPEDIQIHENLIYGFPYGIKLNNGLFLTANNNDIDATTNTGVVIGTLGGVLNINENWIGLVGASVNAGIASSELSTSNNIQKNITGNDINSVVLSPFGIILETNQHNVNIQGNSISNTNQDIYLHSCGDIVVSGNNLQGTTTNVYVISSPASREITISDNQFAGEIFCHPTNNSQIVFGQNHGPTSTLIRGKSIIAAGATSITTTFASLSSAPSNFAAPSNYIVPHLFIQAPTQNVGYVWGVVTDGQVTIYCTIGPATDMTVVWEVKGFPYAL